MAGIKIIGGIYRGRTLKTMPGKDIRPSPSIVREAVYSIISDEIRGAVFGDIFAGCGSIGIEALSRGAGFVHFIETSKAAISLIGMNTSFIEGKPFHIHRADFFSLITTPFPAPLDIAFLDPPYGIYPVDSILEHLTRTSLIKKSGMVIVQVSSKEKISNEIENKITKKKIYGHNDLLFFKMPK